MSGGGGGGTSEVQQPSTPAVPIPPPKPWETAGYKDAVNTQQGYNTLASMRGVPWGQAGSAYNELLNQGFTSDQIRQSSSQMYGAPSAANWDAMVQNAGMNSPTGRPMAGSAQFYQPVYQPQYQDYNMGNRMGVSQYGQGFGGFNPYMMQMQTPFNPYINSFQSPFSYAQQPMMPNYGPSQPIVSRSAGMRGTPNVMMRRAEGGIASLVDE